MNTQPWTESWHTLRGAYWHRGWLTLGDVQAALRREGIVASRYVITQAVASDPPAKVGTMKRYDERHVAMVREYVTGNRA
jgi:hypothetical protein